MARLYANENSPLPVVDALRALGHDVLTSRDAGKSGRAIPDEEVLAFAVAEQRAVLTLNRRHFIRLHQQSPVHNGIVVCTIDAQFSELAARIHTVVTTVDDLRGQCLRVNRPE